MPGVSTASLAAASALSAEFAAAVRLALRELFRAHPVVNLQDIRAHLREFGEPASPARQAATLGDEALHAIVAGGEGGGGEYVGLRGGAYAARGRPNDESAPLRSIILDLLAERGQIRKADIIAAARLRGVALVEVHYMRIMRDLCRNNVGVSWTVRTGKDDA